jgi:hypothetical protein
MNNHGIISTTASKSWKLPLGNPKPTLEFTVL